MKIVLCTAPVEFAETLASTLIDERLAACVNVHASVASVYRWNGAVERATESLLVVKTSDAAHDRLVARIAEIHPHDVPEIVTLDVARGNAPYLAWIDSETSSVKIPPRFPASVTMNEMSAARGRAKSRPNRTEGPMAAKKKAVAKKAAKKTTAKKTAKKK